MTSRDVTFNEHIDSESSLDSVTTEQDKSSSDDAFPLTSTSAVNELYGSSKSAQRKASKAKRVYARTF